MEEKIVIVLNEMSEYLSITQMKKLQEVIIKTFADNEASKVEISNEEFLKMFLDAKRIEGCSERTIIYYQATVKHLLSQITTEVRKITTEEIREYLSKYQKWNNCSNVTIDNVRRNISSFFSWLEEEDYILKSPMKRIHKIKTKTVVKSVISDEGIEKLRDNCNEKRDLSDVEIDVCSIEKQREIVDILNKIMNILENRDNEIVLLDNLIKARFVEMFVKNEYDWKEVTIAEVCIDMRTGPFGSSLHHDEFVDKGVFVLGIDNAVENTFSYNRMRYITEEKYEKLKRYTVYPGDVIITIMGTVGKAVVIPKNMPKAINTKHLACLTPNTEIVDSYFLVNAFQIHPLIRHQLESQCKGAIMDGDEASAVRFDALMYGIELAYLAGKKYSRARSDLHKKIAGIASVANIPEIQAQTDLINKVLNTDYVDTAGINEFEEIREKLRNLMKYLPNSSIRYDTNFTDEVLSTEWNESELENDDLKNYKAKAEYYIRQHQDNIAIAKLKRNKPLTSTDIAMLEEVLWSEVGTKQDYEQEFGEKPLGEFVREIVGLDMNAAKEAFSEYLTNASLDSRQIYFVNQIVEYIVHNGMMKDLSVLQESPFTDRGSVVEIFTDLSVWMGIRKVIDMINANAVA